MGAPDHALKHPRPVRSSLRSPSAKSQALDQSLRYMQHGRMAVIRGNAYRARMRAQGLRPVQIWVPDVRSPQFAAEAHRQSTLVASADRNSDEMDFVEAVSVDWDE